MVPCLTDGSFTLFESSAIAKYLVAKHAGADSSFQEPRDVQDRALYEQAMSVEEYYFEKNVAAIAVEKLFKPCVSPAWTHFSFLPMRSIVDELEG